MAVQALETNFEDIDTNLGSGGGGGGAEFGTPSTAGFVQMRNGAGKLVDSPLSEDDGNLVSSGGIVGSHLKADGVYPGSIDNTFWRDGTSTMGMGVLAALGLYVAGASSPMFRFNANGLGYNIHYSNDVMAPVHARRTDGPQARFDYDADIGFTIEANQYGHANFRTGSGIFTFGGAGGYSTIEVEAGFTRFYAEGEGRLDGYGGSGYASAVRWTESGVGFLGETPAPQFDVSAPLADDIESIDTSAIDDEDASDIIDLLLIIQANQQDKINELQAAVEAHGLAKQLP